MAGKCIMELMVKNQNEWLFGGKRVCWKFQGREKSGV
jgi:hypothetical protein